MEAAWTVGEATAVIGLALAMLIQIVVSLRFLYKMEARVESIAEAIRRLEKEMSAFHQDFTRRVDRLAQRGEETLILKEQVGTLLDRVNRLENRNRGGD